MKSIYFFFLAFFMIACQQEASFSQAPSQQISVNPSSSVVKTGATVLSESGFQALQGKHVGLITNHTAKVGDRHLIDLLYEAPNVHLVALFGPEHGIRGSEDAGAKISNGKDDRTGLPIYSLYGNNRKPTATMLAGIDVLVFDIQDVGARFYTYISTMGLAMQAAAQHHISFMVLDRPNPLDGNLVSGFVLEKAFTSFVGQYPIPVVHGLTVGELAKLVKGERMLAGLEGLDLQVVEVSGWKRWQSWNDTNLPWIAPSPNIPDVETAQIYPATCFFEATPTISEGRGTYEPFKKIGAPWANGTALAQTLNAKNLGGVMFEPISFTPQSIQGMSDNPKLKNQAVNGVKVHITEYLDFDPVAVGVHMLHAFYQQANASQKRNFFNKDWLGKLSGSNRLYEMLTQGASPETIIASWKEELMQFNTLRAYYLLY